MSLLELERVAKRYRRGELERQVLRDVCLQIDPGELAVVWGLRGSGRSTLLRLAAGIESPDSGVVRFDGRDLAKHAEKVLGAGIGFCQRPPLATGYRPALELVMTPLLASGVAPRQARLKASRALEHAGAADYADVRASALETDEALRVAIARVLALAPRLLVIDDPIHGVDLLRRDGLLGLLRSLADSGLAVLVSTGDSTALSGADLTLSLSQGVLRGPPASELAPVLPLRRAAQRGGA
jgi:ABC-type lipoprotein export system ATPase subunit